MLDREPSNIEKVLHWANVNGFAMLVDGDQDQIEVMYSSPNFYQGHQITTEQLIELYDKCNTVK